MPGKFNGKVFAKVYYGHYQTTIELFGDHLLCYFKLSLKNSLIITFQLTVYKMLERGQPQA